MATATPPSVRLDGALGLALTGLVSVGLFAGWLAYAAGVTPEGGATLVDPRVSVAVVAATGLALAGLLVAERAGAVTVTVAEDTE